LKARIASLTLLLIVALNAMVLLPLSIHVRGIAAYLLFVPVIGYLLTAAVGLHRHSLWPEQALIAFGAGYSITVLVTLALTYLPGGLQPWQTLTAFDAFAIILLLLALRHASDSHTGDTKLTAPSNAPWPWLGAVTIVVVAGFLRLPGLDYSEFQDDEVSVVWQSAEAIQGRADALFIHDKGPAEILLTTAVYSAVDRLNEAAARFPFAMAGVVGLLALYWLGWRLFSPLAGWSAAMFLAVDGYFVGFARVVQYQSVVLLMIVLVAGIMLKYVRRPASPPAYLYFAALFLATGVLAHYEAALAFLPVGAFALLSIRRRDSTLRRLRHLGLATLLGAAILAAFYAPFSLHPRFARTFSEIAGNRIGAGFPYNNLGDFFTRTIIYNSSYFFIALTLAMVVALTGAYRRTLPRWAAWTASATLVGGLALTFSHPEWLAVGGHDHIWLFFALALAPQLLTRKLPATEQTVWLWFAAAMLLALFVVQKPRTHVYDFLIPWALLAGNAVEQTWRALEGSIGHDKALAIGLPAAAALILLFGNYVYLLFAYNGAEVLRTWQENRPAGYWTPYAEPRQNAMFGFPFKNGWKVVGALYASGELDGPFARNGKRGIANWYTRGAGDCSRDARYYVFTPWNEPVNKGLLDPQRRPTAEEGYHLIRLVQVNGEPRLEIYERGDAPTSPPIVHNIEDYEALFDAALSSPRFEPDGPAALPHIEHALDFRFGDSIWLKGYRLAANNVRPGNRVDLTLYWQADARPTEDYKVFTQIIDMSDYHKAGQRDGVPGCEEFRTSSWLPGDVIVDRYAIMIEEDAPEGDYTLLIGLYDTDEDRLNIFTPDGQAMGDALGIDTIFVRP